VSALPRPVRAAALLAVHEAGGERTAAVLRRGRDGDVAVVAEARAPASGGDLAADLPGLLAGLPGRAPRNAVLVTDAVTAVGLDLPPARGAGPERLRGLVRWELEPFLAGEDGPQPVACGWTAPGAEGRVVAAGLPSERRAELAAAFAAAGRRLRAVYPALGCAAALAETPGPASVVELAGGELGVSRVEGGRVVDFRTARADAELPDLGVPDLAVDPGDALLLAGPFPPGVLAAYPEPPLRTGLAELPAGLLAAARHAWGLPGAERVPAVPGGEPAPPVLATDAGRIAVVAAVVAAVVIAAELAIGGLLGRARDRVATLSADVAAREAAAERREALEARRADLAGEEADLRGRLAVHEASRARQAYLPRLLAALAASTPDGLAVDALREDDRGGLTLEGWALTELAVQELRRDLRGRLEPLGLAPRELRVEAAEGRLGRPGYAFALDFATEEPAR